MTTYSPTTEDYRNINFDYDKNLLNTRAGIRLIAFINEDFQKKYSLEVLTIQTLELYEAFAVYLDEMFSKLGDRKTKMVFNTVHLNDNSLEAVSALNHFINGNVGVYKTTQLEHVWVVQHNGVFHNSDILKLFGRTREKWVTYPDTSLGCSTGNLRSVENQINIKFNHIHLVTVTLNGKHTETIQYLYRAAFIHADTTIVLLPRGTHINLAVLSAIKILFSVYKTTEVRSTQLGESIIIYCTKPGAKIKLTIKRKIEQYLQEVENNGMTQPIAEDYFLAGENKVEEFQAISDILQQLLTCDNSITKHYESREGRPIASLDLIWVGLFQLKKIDNRLWLR